MGEAAISHVQGWSIHVYLVKGPSSKVWANHGAWQVMYHFAIGSSIDDSCDERLLAFSVTFLQLLHLFTCECAVAVMDCCGVV